MTTHDVHWADEQSNDTPLQAKVRQLEGQNDTLKRYLEEMREEIKRFQNRVMAMERESYTYRLARDMLLTYEPRMWDASDVTNALDALVFYGKWETFGNYFDQLPLHQLCEIADQSSPLQRLQMLLNLWPMKKGVE